MKRIFLMVLAGLWVAAAFSFEVVPGSTLVITDDSGRTVGEGKIEDDEAELDLLTGFDGLATLTVTAADGSVQTYAVMVGEDGQVTIMEPDGSTKLESALQQDGFSVDVERDDSVGRNDQPKDSRDDGDQAGGEDGDDNRGPGGEDRNDDGDDNSGSDQDDQDGDDDGHHDGQDDDDADDGQHHGHGNGDDDGEDDGGRHGGDD